MWSMIFSLIQVERTLLAQHYAEHADRPFFMPLVTYMSSGPIVAMVWEGPGVLGAARSMLGATDPRASAPGTIRGDGHVQMGRNGAHASDGPGAAAREIGLWFGKDLVQWRRGRMDAIVNQGN